MQLFSAVDLVIYPHNEVSVVNLAYVLIAFFGVGPGTAWALMHGKSQLRSADDVISKLVSGGA
jgi:hypothetical protein